MSGFGEDRGELLRVRRAIKPSIVWAGVAATVVVLDQASKLAVARVVALDQSLDVMPSLSLTLSRNTGVSFSLLKLHGDAQRWPLVILSVVVAVALSTWLVRSAQARRLVGMGAALIVGGAIGNAVDRALLGYVTDFIHVHFGAWSFAIFNLADSAISIGVCLLLLDAVLGPKARAILSPVGSS